MTPSAALEAELTPSLLSGKVVSAESDPADMLERMHVLMASGDWTAAARIAKKLAPLYPTRADFQRTASAILVEAGDSAAAAPFASHAVELDPQNSEYALHAGAVLNLCRKFREAVPLLTIAVKLAPDNAEAYQQISHSVSQLGDDLLAAKFAVKAFRLDATNAQRGIIAAHALSRLSRWLEAVQLLRVVADSGMSSAELHHTISHFLMQLEKWDEALAENALAIDLDGAQSRFHVQRSVILARLQDTSSAAASIRRAIELDPTNLDTRRHAVTVYIEHGEISSAVQFGAELLALAPDHEEYASCMRYLLDAKSMSAVAVDFGEIAALKQAMPSRTFMQRVTFREALEKQCETVMALVLRDIRSRYGESKLGFLWALMEPFVHIGILAIIFQFTMHGRPPMGDNFFLFYYTGVMPYLLLTHLIMHLGHAIKGNKVLLQIPSITPFDILLSRAIVETFTTAIIFLLFLAIFQLAGVNAMPADPLKVLTAFAATFGIGFGFGMICAVVFEFTIAAEHIVGVLTRFLYFCSGIFYVPAMMPLVARDILAWNPFLHLIDYMRMGFFPSYHPAWLDLGYAIQVSVFCLVAGLVVTFLYRRRLRMPS